MIELSEQQKEIVGLPLKALSVTACAGSGKTRTAVHRLAHVREKLEDDHGTVALLSFSNVAVDTFRRDYRILARSRVTNRRSLRVEIDTVDGFITSNVLRPHAHRTMGCNQTPFLVDGKEPFLRGFKVFDGDRTHPTTDLNIDIRDGKFFFSVGSPHPKPVDPAVAKAALKKLGKVGAYTHASARYWVLKTLADQPLILRALTRRYPQILVDEAQDIGPEHEMILKVMAKSGSVLSLIGDANQGIYEFSGANGKFLSDYGKGLGVTARELNKNYRSVPAILKVANALCGRNDEPNREPPSELHGAFYFTYTKSDKTAALGVFRNLLATAKIPENLGVVLCRSNDWADDWSGASKAQGQGIVGTFAAATVYRDSALRMDKAFETTCSAIMGLLHDVHGDLASRLARGVLDSDTLALRRRIWSFVRKAESGLPSGMLSAKDEWHPQLTDRVKMLLTVLSVQHGLATANNLGAKLAKRALTALPLVEAPDLAEAEAPRFRVSTVHKVKGESLEAVMYVASKDHIRSLLEGTGTELGRIGYVAVTRARNLFVLAIPEEALPKLHADLELKGFRKAGTAI